MLKKFLTTFLTKTAAPRRRGRPARHDSPGRRLRVECLETRLTLSSSPVVVVMSSADSGPRSLRAAIGSAVSGETIEFAPSVHSITLTSGELPISTSLNIVGPGANKLTISGNNNSRVFDIQSGTVTVEGLTIANGKVNTPLETTPIYSTWGGGGIVNEPGAMLTLVSDTLSNNQAVGVVGQDEFGGGLFNMGSATVVACTFTNNQVLGAGSYDALGGPAGGAIDNYAGAGLTVANSLFSNNSVVSADGDGYFALGGAIENNAGTNGFAPIGPGGAVPSTATLTDCTFLNNLAQAGTQADSNGGAILCEGNGTSMTLTGCLISGNRSVGGADGTGFEDGQGLGGGIMNTAGNMVITDCTITNNQAVGGNNANFSGGNPWNGLGSGGGISNGAGGALDIANSTVSGNIAQGGANTSGPGGDGYGGGIESSSALTVTDSRITNNTAIGGLGGAGTAMGTIGADGFGFGGGIDTSGVGATTTLVGCTIASNVAQGSAGANGNSGGDGVGGGLGVGNQGLNGYSTSSQLTVIDCTVVGNQALGGTGGHGANGADGLGGGLAIVDLNGTTPPTTPPTPALIASATLIDSSVENNDALGGEAGYGDSDGQGVGGGVYNLDGTLNVDATDHIMKNFASTSNNNIFSS